MIGLGNGEKAIGGWILTEKDPLINCEPPARSDEECCGASIEKATDNYMSLLPQGSWKGQVITFVYAPQFLSI